MALSKDKKVEQVAELTQLFGSSKMTVIAQYRGLTVKAMQEFRRNARDNGTKVKVVKNRLVKQAMKDTPALKDIDVSVLKDQLLYVFNAEDEVAPAQVIHNFSKQEKNLQFVGAITANGSFLSQDEVKALATLPSKNELIAGVINILVSPAKSVVGSLSGGIPAIMSGLEAKASK